MKWRVALVVLASIATACSGGSGSTTTSAEVPPSEPTLIPDDQAVRDAIVSTAVNNVGLTDVPPGALLDLAEAGCRQGAWEFDVARSLGAAFLDAQAPNSGISLEAMSETVWLMTVAGCRDLFPQAAIDRGPPPRGGQ